jgi:hypothetical protein
VGAPTSGELEGSPDTDRRGICVEACHNGQVGAGFGSVSSCKTAISRLLLQATPNG